MSGAVDAPPVFPGWVWPMAPMRGVAPVISDGFKPFAIPLVRRLHLGVDLMYPRWPTGKPQPPQHTKAFSCLSSCTPVLAAGPGRVWAVDVIDLHGIVVEIDHGLIERRPWVTVYRHLATVAVRRGEAVAAGAYLGLAGCDIAAGPSSPNHLHFELWDCSRNRRPGVSRRQAFAVDPAPHMRSWGLGQYVVG